MSFNWSNFFQGVFNGLAAGASGKPPAAPSTAIVTSIAGTSISVSALAKGVGEVANFDWATFGSAFAAKLTDVQADLVDIEMVTQILADLGFPWANDAVLVEKLIGFAARFANTEPVAIDPLAFEKSRNYKER